MTTAIKQGDMVFVATMPKDSHYKSVQGVVESVRNGFAQIVTTAVKNKWSNEWKVHECRLSAKVENCELVN